MAKEDALLAFQHECGDSLEAKYMAEDASSKKFLVSNFTNYKMTDSRPVIEQYNELLGILGRFTQHKMNMDEAIQVSCIIDKLSPSWKDFKHTLKHQKEELTLVELGSHLCIEESLTMYNDNKGKCKHQDTKADPNKKSKMTCWKYGKPGHLKKECKDGKVCNKANGSGTNGSVDGSTNTLKGATVYVCKDRCLFKTYKSLNDGFIIHMGNESTTLVHGRGCVDLRFSFGKIVSLFNVFHVPNIRKNLVSSTLCFGFPCSEDNAPRRITSHQSSTPAYRQKLAARPQPVVLECSTGGYPLHITTMSLIAKASTMWYPGQIESYQGHWASARRHRRGSAIILGLLESRFSDWVEKEEKRILLQQVDKAEAVLWPALQFCFYPHT
ncbi:hypothetical protein Tco_0774192 [Tanacetum coccineum]|uniref:Retrovirus-related Pol polyprotein from transposon TNT 1-94-like beta-barrel domain-containing protein n=1 Tax=Tanacetum coccineum TaxID=301880 RepID=A0ABQ4ZQ07_9ASTR